MADFVTTAEDNCHTLLSVRDLYDSVEDFLAADDILPFYSCHLPDVTSFCNLTYDIDGIVIFLENLAGLALPMYYLKLPQFQKCHLRPAYTMLKKHLDLKNVNAQAMQNLKTIFWVPLGTTDEGFFVSLVGLPSDLMNPDPLMSKYSYVKEHTVELLNRVLMAFKDKLRALTRTDLARPTLQKTCLTNLSMINLLPQDQNFVLGLLDDCIQSHGRSHRMYIQATVSKFGMKDPSDLDIGSIVDLPFIQRISIHAACRIVPRDPKMNILWSRAGLQESMGERGLTYTAMGMHEAVNWQSSLDGRPMDVSPEVRRMCKPEEITFLQFYCESPHLHVPFGYKHPVSGPIATCGLSHYQLDRAMRQRAKTYIKQMEDLQLKLACQLTCRIEQVATFEHQTRIPEGLLHPSRFFSVTAIRRFLTDKPVFLAFRDNEESKGLLTVSQEAINYMVGKLKALFHMNAGKGSYAASWETYQLELGLESFFFGHPLCTGDYTLSVSLGTDSSNENSLTRQRGFLGLAPYSSASAGTVPPPLNHWVSFPVQILRIERIFPMTDCLGAGPPVVGEQLVLVLLKDLYERNDGIPLGQMASRTPPGILKSHNTLDEFCKELATRDSFPAPLTFGRARTLARNAGVDVVKALKAGFELLGLRYFPDIKFRDFRKQRRVYWNGTNFLELLRPTDKPSPEALAASLTGDVCLEIERRTLSYSRNLQRYRDFGMPWMKSVVVRLPPNLQEKDRLNLLCFLSCIGMLQNADYVSYEQLKELVRELPLPQSRLQAAKLQSNFSLPPLSGLRVWKLHEDIPYRMDPKPAGIAPQRQPLQVSSSDDSEEELDNQQAVDVDEEYRRHTTLSACLPATSKRPWSSLELSLVDTDAALTAAQAFLTYLKVCREKNIPYRTWHAFEAKRRRMMND